MFIWCLFVFALHRYERPASGAKAMHESRWASDEILSASETFEYSSLAVLVWVCSFLHIRRGIIFCSHEKKLKCPIALSQGFWFYENMLKNKTKLELITE